MTAWAGLVTVACCSAAIIRLTTVRAIRTEVTAPEALTAVATATAAAAFDDSRRRNPHLICRI